MINEWHWRASWRIQGYTNGSDMLEDIATVKHFSLCFSINNFSCLLFMISSSVKKQNPPLVLFTRLTSGLPGLHYLFPLGIVNYTQLMRLQAHTIPDVNQWQVQNWNISEWKSYLSAFKLIGLPWIGSKLCFLNPVLLKGKIILNM